MIDKVIHGIAKRANEFIQNKLNLEEEILVVRALTDINGKVSPGVENKICMFLVGVEEEKIVKNNKLSNNPAIYININVMFAAYFPESNYLNSLRFISLVIDFFQNNPIFDFQNTEGLPLNIPKLHAEILNMQIEESMRIWGSIGPKYIPSCAYKIRQLVFDSGDFIEDIGFIS